MLTMEKDLKDYLTPPVLLVVFLLILSLLFITPVLSMVVLGAILAYYIRPIAKRFQNKLKLPSASVILAMIVVIIPLILLVGYILFEVFSVLSDFVFSNPAVSQFDLNTTVTDLVNYLPVDNSTATVASVTSSIENALMDVVRYFLDYIVSLASKITTVALELFVLIVSVFYFTRDGDKCWNFLMSFVPYSSKDFVDKTVKSVDDVLKSIFYGHFLTSLIIGIIALIGYSILGYPYGIFLGILTGIFQLIPVFGPWPIYWTLAIIDAINGNYIRMIIVLLFGFGLSLSDMYIRPALSSHYADIHPLILLIGFLAGPLVYGIVGFILGPLILGITYAVLNNFRLERERSKKDES